MDTPTIPNTARGEALVTIGDVQHTIRISMNVMRDWSKLTGHAASEFAQQLEDNYPDTAAALVACAVRRYVPDTTRPAVFGVDEAADFIEQLPPAEATVLAEAIIEAVTPDPLLRALRQQVAAKAAAKAQGMSGAATSNSPLAS